MGEARTPDREQSLGAHAARGPGQGRRVCLVVALGPGGGAAFGAAQGGIPHGISQMASRTQPRGMMNGMKPGFRMAGGLVGTILGGGLGAAMQQQAVSEPSGAGALLAKIQATGEVTAEDEMRLESVLRDAYSQQGLLG